MQAPQSGSNLEAWLAYQQRSHPQGIDLTLERVRAVAARLGLLAPDCPVVTVGGTNGKGSTATTLASLLQTDGLQVGLFTSPHLVRYHERVQLDAVPVSDAQLVTAFEHIEAARGSDTLTFFEYNTLAALHVFRAAQVGAIVLEVGLGGRLDATNVIDADVAVLCSIGMDHREWLGETLEAIGAEKAGIFRARRPVVLGSAQMPQSVWRALDALGCTALVAEQQFHWQTRTDAGTEWDFRLSRADDASGGATLESLPAPALSGAIQYRNAATAIAALYCLRGRRALDVARISAGLRATRLPGRLQIVPGEVEWILDVAHNEPAAQVLAAALAARASRRTFAVAGILADKDAAAIGRALDATIDHWILAGLEDEPRAQSAAALAARLPPLRGTVELATDPVAACARAASLAQPGDRVVVLGSFHTVGPALRWLGLY